MFGKTAILAGLLALGALVAPHMSSAAPLSPATSALDSTSLVTKVQYEDDDDDDRPSCRRICVSHDSYGNCRRWRRVCSY